MPAFIKLRAKKYEKNFGHIMPWEITFVNVRRLKYIKGKWKKFILDRTDPA